MAPTQPAPNCSWLCNNNYNVINTWNKHMEPKN